jgi:tetratricopeptide (TPR) repeat protein
MAVSTSTGITVRCHRGRPPAVPGALEIDLGSDVAVAMTGLRRIVASLRSETPEVVDRVAARHAIEWAELFPSDQPPAVTLWDVANSPSERRLHRESEQVFRVLQAGGRALVDAMTELERPLVLRNCGTGDVVSLRGVMRAVERSRSSGATGVIVCGEWEAPAPAGSMGDRKQGQLDRLRERMGANLEDESSPAGAARPATPIDAVESPERHHLRVLTDPERPAADRVASALLAIRSCFFSTNYEGSLFACDHALELLRERPEVAAEDVASAFTALDDGVGTPAIEIAAETIDGPRVDLEALLWRSIGVNFSLMGDQAAGMEMFERALAARPSRLAEATLRMYVGLLLSKRMSRVEDAVDELCRGLTLVETDTSPRASVVEGWLRNVVALTYFKRSQLRDAYEEEVRALRKVAQHHDPSATHLKINVISNLSVLQETAGRCAEALKVWRRFMEISSEWGPNFIKHYSYREGGLHLANGDEAAALASYQRSFDSAAATDDAFHRTAIAVEIGTHHLAGGRREEAARWFADALACGQELGDPYRIGQAMAGLALATGEPPGPAARMLALSTTYPEPARALASAIEGRDDTAVAAALPRPITKLNRPFNLVNL